MRKHKIKMIVVLIIPALVVLGIGAFHVYGNMQLNKVPGLSFREALEYTLEGKDGAAITVGVLKDGKASYTVYGKDGAELPHVARAYEIGSLTKTFTAALVQRAINDGRLSMSGVLDEYLELTPGNGYPTIRRLATHTSGFKGYYFESPMIENFLSGRNSFYGISDAMLTDRLRRLSIRSGEHPFNYSNFGYAALGLVLEAIYGEDYAELVNRFAQDELGLSDTYISHGAGGLKGGWDWREDDAYRAAGALISNIDDMLEYARLQLKSGGLFDECHKDYAKVNATTDINARLGIRIDEVDMAWLLDAQRGIVWHNGATGSYNCYMGIHKDSGAAVVILSNLSPDYRIPATVLGVKLLDEIIK